MVNQSQLDRPLFAEPFLAWRAWNLVEAGSRLRSIVYEHVWEPGERVEAECAGPRPEGVAPYHPAPDEDCQCGVYGSLDPDLLRYYVQETRKEPRPHGVKVPNLIPSESRVFGLVSLWGTIVEYTKGYRAQFAYPAHLYLPCLMHEYADKLDVYGVPVTCVDDQHGFEALRAVMRAARREAA